jgi:hypothetical protein
MLGGLQSWPGLGVLEKIISGPVENRILAVWPIVRRFIELWRPVMYGKGPRPHGQKCVFEGEERLLPLLGDVHFLSTADFRCVITLLLVNSKLGLKTDCMGQNPS